ncbi:Translocator protein homolog [Striga hermonthica]|uniref:Translocator protein homolog n=1 Tax=Striga hermonthica TaxID=68872 RepID=A0A9N7NMR0_STRHE|nr:Translocator protein homolog [Striga hermonthica]
MASQDLKRRPQPESVTRTHQQPPAAAASRRGKLTAGRGLRSLTAALAFPISLSVLDIYLFGSAARKPFYFPPLWALHLACLASALLSGLSAWLVWADGGFHRSPNALMLYLGQLAVGLGWYPVVFRAGAVWAGLGLCVALFGAMIGCERTFGRMNPIAGGLVRPCLAWAVLISVLNVRLLLC